MADRPTITKGEFKKLLAARLCDPETKARDFIALAKMYRGLAIPNGKRRPKRDMTKPPVIRGLHALVREIEEQIAASKKRDE